MSAVDLIPVEDRLLCEYERLYFYVSSRGAQYPEIEQALESISLLRRQTAARKRETIKRGLSRLGHQPECVSVGCHDAHCHCPSCLEVRLNDPY